MGLDDFTGQTALDDAPKIVSSASIQEEFKPEIFAWADMVGQQIVLDMGHWAQMNGMPLPFMQMQYGQRAADMFDAIYTDLFASANRRRTNAQRYGLEYTEDMGVLGMGADYFTHTNKGMQEMIEFARGWMSRKTGFDLTASPRGRSGSGRSGPSAQDIRDQFDVDELANAINDMNRALVLEEHSNSKGLARKYIDSVVASGGKKKIDFETFVRGKIESTARFKNIYKNKPDSVAAETYIAPYLQSAMQFASPDEAGELAIGGAQFGASAEQFRQRLRRTDAVTGSSPYINQLEARMASVSNILKG